MKKIVRSMLMCFVIPMCVVSCGEDEFDGWEGVAAIKADGPREWYGCFDAYAYRGDGSVWLWPLGYDILPSRPVPGDIVDWSYMCHFYTCEAEALASGLWERVVVDQYR